MCNFIATDLRAHPFECTKEIITIPWKIKFITTSHMTSTIIFTVYFAEPIKHIFKSYIYTCKFYHRNVILFVLIDDMDKHTYIFGMSYRPSIFSLHDHKFINFRKYHLCSMCLCLAFKLTGGYELSFTEKLHTSLMKMNANQWKMQQQT